MRDALARVQVAVARHPRLLVTLLLVGLLVVGMIVVLVVTSV